ncbi:MAG: IclR family transcriptional regulator [Afipia sp.]|nr:IclR family transcriptional regulator [Afipia sp.]OJW65924.1 MAG: IclR family transcriptional regulator [Afipia sp. 64-13]
MAVSDKDTNGSSGVAAVERALSIVEAVEASAEPQTLAQISQRTGLYKSTILRLLVTLERRGLIVRWSDGRYALGPAAFRLGLAYGRFDQLRGQAIQVLHDLVNKGTESASIHIRHDATTRLCLCRVDSTHATLDRIAEGDLLPLDRGAAGRLLLAFEGKKGAAYDRLRSECFALSTGERESGCSGIAAPIFGVEGSIKATLSLSGPSERFTDERIASMRKLLMKAAATITASLGGTFPDGHAGARRRGK